MALIAQYSVSSKNRNDVKRMQQYYTTLELLWDNKKGFFGNSRDKPPHFGVNIREPKKEGDNLPDIVDGLSHFNMIMKSLQSFAHCKHHLSGL